MSTPEEQMSIEEGDVIQFQVSRASKTDDGELDQAAEAFKRQRAIVESASHDDAARIDVEESQVTEYVDSIEIEVPNAEGNAMVIEMARPSTVSMLIFDRLFPRQAPSHFMATLAKAMMYIQKIDGVTVPELKRESDIHDLARRIGDAGIDQLMQAFATYFTPRTELTVLKKNQRRS